MSGHGTAGASAAVTLVLVVRGPTGGRTVHRIADGVEIGRGPGCDLRLNAPVVSVAHARITRVTDGFDLLDLGSRHGTRVDGEALPGGTAHRLAEGETISIGPFELDVYLDAAMHGTTRRADGGAGAGGRSEAGPEWSVLVVRGPGRGRGAGFGADAPVTLGATPDCDVVVPDAGEVRVTFWVDPEGRPFADAHGGAVVLRGAAVRGMVEVADGDRVLLGGSTLRLDAPPTEGAPRWTALEIAAIGVACVSGAVGVALIVSAWL
jgi:pSer/pThr/pTyr-binding forkhead associated (FHA) protein